MSSIKFRIVLFALLAACPVAARGDISVEEIAERHRATVESLQSLRCNYTQTIRGLTETDHRRQGRYLRRGEVVMIEESAGSTSKSNVRRDGESVRSVQKALTQARQDRYVASIKAPNDLLGTTDLYLPLMFQIQHPSEKRIFSLGEYYSRCRTSTHRDTLQGRRCIRVDAKYTVGEATFAVRNWHDPARGYLVVRSESTISSDSQERLMRVELEDWLEADPVYLPQKITLTNHVDGKPQYTHTIALTGAELNPAIAAAELDLPAIPSGTPCTDYTRGKSYAIDANWKRIGEEKDFVVQRVETPPEAQIAAESFGGRPTQEQGRSVWMWIALVSAVGVIASLAWMTLRRKRKVASDS